LHDCVPTDVTDCRLNLDASDVGDILHDLEAVNSDRRRYHSRQKSSTVS